MPNPRIKRVYDPPSPDDGFRILIDGLWPRGLRKDQAKVDLWLKAIAPSAELRKWFSHDPALWDEFRRRYAAELDHNAEVVAELRAHIAGGTVTLLYAAKETRYRARWPPRCWSWCRSPRRCWRLGSQHRPSRHPA